GVVGDRSGAPTLDETNLVGAPGFLDLLGQSEVNGLGERRAASKILQGVTTEVTGEGSSIAPVNDRLIAEAAPQAKAVDATQDWRARRGYIHRLPAAPAPP